MGEVERIFRNVGQLLEQRPNAALRRRALEIAAAALEAVHPANCIRRHLELRGSLLRANGLQWDLKEFRRVLVVGAGKASAAMAAAVEELLGDRIAEGWVNVKDGYEVPTSKVVVHSAAHPEPDERTLKGTTAIVEMLRRAGRGDLVIALLSGGGSALLEMPADGVDLEDIRSVTRPLLASGATIVEINTVRRALSKVKGGGLAAAAYPAQVLVLVLSDVVGDDLSAVASGPFFPSRTGAREAVDVLMRYGLWDGVSLRIRRSLEEDRTQERGTFEHVRHLVVGNIRDACRAAVLEAEKERASLLLTASLEGEAREVGKVVAALARELKSGDGHPLSLPACLVLGGESTVTVRGSGLGGRNQEMALSAALGIEALEGVVILCLATDGGDGPTEAAGAMVDGHTAGRGRRMGMDPLTHLAKNDSYTFLASVGDVLLTGPTGTNVNDLCIALADS
jgi:hydroxypyruvate reductase